MAVTYEPIASSLPSGASTVDFTSIPGTYTDLILVYHLTGSSGGEDIWLRYNSDTAQNYSWTALGSNGTSVVSGRNTTASAQTNRAIVDYYAIPGTSTRAMGIIQVMSYANTNVFKTGLCATARADAGVDRTVHLWRSTSAITSVSIFAGTGTVSGTASLYGIKAA